MLRPRWRKVLRDLWLHKARTFLVVLAIAIGIAGAGSVLDTWALLRRVTRDEFSGTNPASATIRTDAIDSALLAAVRAHPAVGEVAARRTVVGAVQARGSWRTAMLFATNDLSAVTIGKVQTEAGTWPPADGAIAIEKSSVDFAGVALGQSVTLQIGEAEPRALEVVGIARDAGLAPGWMEHIVYAFVTPATLAMLGAPSDLNQLQFTVRDRSLEWEAVRRIAYEVKALVERTGRRVADVDVPEPGAHIHAGQINSLLLAKGAFGLLALLLSGFLVVNLISAMLTGQVREIGVMKALGARSGQLAAMYLALALLLGFVACLVALPVAALVGRAYAGFIAEILNFDTTGFSIPTWAFALQVAVGLLLPVAAASIPVIRGCRIPVSEALRDFGIAGQDHESDTGWLSRLGGVTRPLLLSLRNAFRKRQRMALTLITLAMGGAVYLGSLNLRTSIQRSVSYLFGDILRYDISIRLTRPMAPDSIERAIQGVAGVGAVEGWSSTRTAVSHADSTLGNAFPLVGQPAGSKLVAFPLVEGRWLTEGSRRDIVVSDRMLKEEPQLRLGSAVTLIVSGRPTIWTIVGVARTGVQPGAYTTRAALAEALGNGSVALVTVRAADRDPSSHGALSRRIRGELEAKGVEIASSQLMEESRSVLEDHLLTVAQTLTVMSQLMILVGGLGLASTMSLAVLERTREIGVMRAIGARHGAIHTMVQAEGLVIALASWLVALPLSVPMSVLVGKAFGRVMLPVPTHIVPGGGGVLQWLLVVVGVSVVASAWPAIRATRVPVARALSYE
ncbi:MAG: ABC transporter permease [Gemmatimonadales bacterium]|nr:ABC transporter permease [Gemmatimonadales bacterium]